MFNAIEALFAPGRKHTDDEQKRLELTRVDLADGDPGRGPIDLSSGTVVVRAPVPSPRGDATAGTEAEPEGAEPGDGAESPGGDSHRDSEAAPGN